MTKILFGNQRITILISCNLSLINVQLFSQFLHSIKRYYIAGDSLKGLLGSEMAYF